MASTLLRGVGLSCWKPLPVWTNGRLSGQRLLSSCLPTTNEICIDRIPRWSRFRRCDPHSRGGQNNSSKYNQERPLLQVWNSLGPFTTQIRCYDSQNYYRGSSMYYQTPAERDLAKKQLFTDLIKEGKLKLPKPKAVDNLPPKPSLTGQETFIAIGIEFYPQQSDLVAINAVSDGEEFVQFCKPKEQLSDSFKLITGLDYDVMKDELLFAGKPVETVEPQNAVENLFDFVKQFENPIFITYDNRRRTLGKLDALLDKYDISPDDFVQTVPFFIDALQVALLKVPKEQVPNHRLDTLCQNLLDLHVPVGDPRQRVDGLYKLFTRYLLPTGCQQFVRSLAERRVENTYLEMFLSDQIFGSVMTKLSRAGLSLDHMKLLYKDGWQEFMQEIQRRNIGISVESVRALYSHLSKAL